MSCLLGSLPTPEKKPRDVSVWRYASCSSEAFAGVEVRWTKKLAVWDVSTFLSLEDRSSLCLADEMPCVGKNPCVVRRYSSSSWRHVAASSATWSPRLCLQSVDVPPGQPACEMAV
ncbi:uncharacterized protein FYN16_011241 [Cariama cristata]